MLIGDTIFKGATRCVIAWLGLLGSGFAQQDGNVAVSFLPPPLENATYSVGIYEAKSGKLIRTLQQSAAESAFTVGLNGLMTKWDRKDDAGKTVPPGKYAARGYAVGPLKVEGIAFHGNDWVEQDESLRIKNINAIALVPEDDGLAVLAEMSADHYSLLRFSGKDGSMVWKQSLDSVFDGALKPNAVPEAADPHEAATAAKRGKYVEQFGVVDKFIRVGLIGAGESVYNYRVIDGVEDEGKRRIHSSPPDDPGIMSPGSWSDGKDRTHWFLDEEYVAQYSLDDPPLEKISEQIKNSPPEEGRKWMLEHALRLLKVKSDEPKFKWVSASTTQDRLYLLEKTPGWQRVRGLSWIETKDEGGKKVSTWETFFERNIRAPDPALGLEDPTTAKAPSPIIEMTLAENELSPGKPAKAKLTASFDDKGSYLSTADGLRLRKIGERANLRAVKLAKAKSLGSLSFFQTDGAAWDEFSIAGADKIMGFDAGEFELTATGEKPAESKPPEPDL